MSPGVRQVIYQGTSGAFSEEAARRLLGPAVSLRGLPTLEAVRDALQSGFAQYAVVPVRNSIAGEVPGASAICQMAGTRVEAQISLPIVQCLIVPPGTARADVRRVVSHPMAIAQCRRYLDSLPWRLESHDDTAGALRMIIESGAPDAAVIAGESAVNVWGGRVLRRGIQDRKDNRTTFALVERLLL